MNSPASITNCLVLATLVVEAWAVIVVSREQIEFLHCFKHIFALMTIYSLFVSLLIKGGKDVIFPNSKRI